MTKAPAPVRTVSAVDPGVIAHYLKMALDVLEAGELSEIRLSTHLGRTIRDISRVAGIPGMGADVNHTQVSSSGSVDDTLSRNPSLGEMARPGPRLVTEGYGSTSFPPSDSGANNVGDRIDPFLNSQTSGGGFDIENFLQLESHLDLGYWLGTPGDSTSAGALSANPAAAANTMDYGYGGQFDGWGG